MNDQISQILDRCGTSRSVLHPTHLYNEGWMLCLILDYFDRHRTIPHELAFEPGAIWYSEAFLKPQFSPGSSRNPRPLGEGPTHADGMIGHFFVKSGEQADAVLLSDPMQWVVVEAKLGSGLSKGITHAPNYDQAARNVACMVNMLGAAGVDPGKMKRLAFYVVAPREKIDEGKFGTLVTRESIREKVRDRVAAFNGLHDEWFNAIFLPTLEFLDIKILAWEQILDALPPSEEVDGIKDFYGSCIKFNLKQKKK